MLFCIFDVFLLDQFLSIFFKSNYNKSKIFKYASLIGVAMVGYGLRASTIPTLCIDTIGTVLYIIYACTIYEEKYTTKIIFTIIFHILFMLITMIVLNLLAYLFKTNISDMIVFYTYKRLVVIWGIKLTVYFLILAVEKTFKKPHYNIPNITTCAN